MFRPGAKQRWQTGCLAEIRDGGVVPAGARALALKGGAALLRAGETLTGSSILVPVESLEVLVTLNGLSDRDGIEATIEFLLEIDPPDGTTGLRLLAKSIGGSKSYQASDLAAELAALWSDVLVARVAHTSWAEEGDLIERLELSADIPETVRAALFDRGLRLERIRSARAASEQLSVAQEARRHRREEAARIRERLEFFELWKKEERGEALARDEVERLVTHLRQQGLLRKIEDHKEEHLQQLEAHKEMAVARQRLNRRLERERLISKVEIDEERLLKELEQAEQLKKAFERNGWLALVQAVDDPEGKTRLLERLIEKEMTPEQIAARGASNAHVERLEAKIEDLCQHIDRQGVPAPLRDPVGSLRPVRRVWLAAGLALYRIDGDPAGADREARPVLPPEEIGYLRSVRVTRDEQGVVIVVGGQGGVGLYRPEGSHWEIFRFRPGEAGRNGANAVAVQGSLIVASHSRLGLTIWDRNDSRAFRRLYEGNIVPGLSTRGIQESAEGGWIFGHGSEVMQVKPGAPFDGLVSLGKLPESVTALCR
jgi:hypothetical protein